MKKIFGGVVLFGLTAFAGLFSKSSKIILSLDSCGKKFEISARPGTATNAEFSGIELQYFLGGG